MWKVSHSGGPPAPPLNQSVYQPPLPPSGMTTIAFSPAVMRSASPASVHERQSASAPCSR